nr:GNAT family N-acetyltransferase [Anaerolineae bacterium]
RWRRSSDGSPAIFSGNWRIILALTRSSVKPAFKVRLYRGEDREGLISVVNAVCAEGRWMRTRRFEPTPAWEHALANSDCPCHLLLMAIDGPRIIGWCRIFPTGEDREGEVGLGLLPPYRNQGLGTQMLRQAVQWAKTRRFSRLILTTRADNGRAICVFKSCGFTAAASNQEGWMEMALSL